MSLSDGRVRWVGIADSLLRRTHNYNFNECFEP